MKRFITYLYEYKQGQKERNAGFIRVDIRKGMVTMEVCIRNYIRPLKQGQICALVGKKTLMGIVLGEIDTFDGQGSIYCRFNSENIMETDYSLEEVTGIGIRFANQIYLASCWEDAYAQEIAEGNFELTSKRIEAESVEVAEEMDMNLEILSKEVPREEEAKEDLKMVSFQKVHLNQIRSMPSSNWYLCNNRFLVHGFFNYGYLVLKTETTGMETIRSLGVPGIFEKPEMVMATLFGFQEFQTLSEAVSEAEMETAIEVPNIEKSQEPKIGTFGCWLIPLRE